MTVLYLEALIGIALSLSILMALAWVVQQRTGNSGWVDTIWTFAVGLVGAAGALLAGRGRLPERAAMAGRGPGRDLVAAARRPYRDPHAPEYRMIRATPRSPRSGARDSPRRMFIFLQNQAFGSIPLVFAIFVAARVPLRRVAVAGLSRRADPGGRHRRRSAGGRATEGLPRASRQQGRVCDAGLWRWSRHPNYFFEWLGWLAYPVIALSPDYPWGWASLLAPAFMYWILVHVTGIPPLEAQMLRSRGERYRDYQSRTSAFFPLPPHEAVVT